MENLDLWTALANILLVGALVIVTWWYARSMKRQVERPINIELCKILYYFYNQLSPEIEHLKNKVFVKRRINTVPL